MIVWKLNEDLRSNGNQQFKYTPDGRYVSKLSGLVLDLAGGKADGAISVWRTNDDIFPSNQVWPRVYTPSPTHWHLLHVKSKFVTR